MSRIIMLVVAWIILATIPAKSVDTLKGKYAFVATYSCLDASGGFNDIFQALSSTFSNSFSQEGIRTFNGDGTGAVVNRSMGITVPPTTGFFPAASSGQGTASFTYTVSRDRFTVRNVVGTAVSTFLTGPQTGQTVTSVGIPDSHGIIGDDGKTLVSFYEDPGVETLIFFNGGVPTGEIIKRVCHNMVVLTRLGDE
jgi:hypothetical protein